MADIGWPASYDDDGNPVDMLADPLPEEQKTELGYARRLVHVYGDRLRYVPAWRRWLVWDGARWAHDGTGQAARWMKAVATRLTADALALEDGKQRAAALHATRRGESSHAIAGALALASTEAGIAVSPGQLDADPFLLNCANGTADLRTGELRRHRPGDLLTKVTRAAWHPQADSTAWDGFLRRVQPEEHMRAYLARLTGHCLEGRVSEHVLPVHYGAGANGKTTFAEAVAFALGDYAGPADPDLLTARSYDPHPCGVADLFGVRLAVLHETDAGRRLAEAAVKRLTGGDRVKARLMRQDFWSFEPSHTFMMMTTCRPVITGRDDGIWRRLRLVPWEVQVPADEQDGGLADTLRLSADAVLAWLARGYADWREHGLADPEQVTKATTAWRAESDALGRFIEQRCLTGPRYSARSAVLFAAWCGWCEDEHEDPGTQTAFSLELARLGYVKRRTGTGAVWDGLGVVSDGFDGSGPSRPTRAGGKPSDPSNPSRPAGHGQADGPAVPPPVLCAVCRTPLDPALADAGSVMHPACDPGGGEELLF